MSWNHAQYVDYVRKHAPPAELRSLLQAASRPYNAQHPKLFLTYYSMPDWLDVSSSFASHANSLAWPRADFDKRLTTTPFNRMIAEYKHAAKRHQDKVAEALNIIATLPSGLALLREVGRTRYTLRVMPYWHHFKTMPGSSFPNATPQPLLPGESLSHISDGTFANDKDAYAKNTPVREDDGDPLSEIGTGKGANVVLFFSPEDWENTIKQRNPGFEPDEVLFHELIHITRMFRGLMTRAPVEGRGGYGNIEEYFATVITNVYLSDKGQTRLRGLYGNELIRQAKREVAINDKVVMVITDPLPKDWSVMKDPDDFYNNPGKLTISPRALMKGFSTTQADFYRALAHLPAAWPRFNPVRRHFRENLRPDV